MAHVIGLGSVCGVHILEKRSCGQAPSHCPSIFDGTGADQQGVPRYARQKYTRRHDMTAFSQDPLLFGEGFAGDHGMERSAALDSACRRRADAASHRAGGS